MYTDVLLLVTNYYADVHSVQFAFSLASLQKNTGLVVANDAKRERTKALVANIHRLGEFSSVFKKY